MAFEDNCNRGQNGIADEAQIKYDADTRCFVWTANGSAKWNSGAFQRYEVQEKVYQKMCDLKRAVPPNFRLNGDFTVL